MATDNEIGRLLKALANRRRLQVIRYLARTREATVAGIAEYLKLSLKATSKHLQLLMQADILDRRQQSLFVYYRLVKPPHPVVREVLTLL